MVIFPVVKSSVISVSKKVVMEPLPLPTHTVLTSFPFQYLQLLVCDDPSILKCILVILWFQLRFAYIMNILLESNLFFPPPLPFIEFNSQIMFLFCFLLF